MTTYPNEFSHNCTRFYFFAQLELFQKLTFLFENKIEVLQYSPFYKHLNCLIAKQELFLIIEWLPPTLDWSLDAWNFLFGGD